MKRERIAVIGAGGWGTALSVIWARQGRAILLCGNDPSRVEELRASRENSAYLPGVNLPEAIGLTSDLHSCANADLIVFVTPSTALRETAARLAEVKINSNAVLLSCIKGIEHGTGKRMSEILAELFPQHTIAVLSGPNLATEVSRGLPTATVLACTRQGSAEDLQKYLGTPRFRIYTGEELVGIELGGALKNVRSEEHTSELQSQSNLVCRLLLEKKKTACNRWTHAVDL